jgi:hypothetical protein
MHHKNKAILILILALMLFGLIWFIDHGLCNHWVYHDYAAGIDRRLACFWQKKGF